MAEIDGESNPEATGYLASAGTDWVRIQRSTFTNWCNEHLRKKSQRTITNLSADLKDGVILMQLLEALSKKPPPRYNRQPRIKQQMLENLITALDFISREGIKLVNIGNEDIFNGKEKLILGLVWGLIQHYQIKARKTAAGKASAGGSSAKDAMKAWLREVLPEKNIRNFTRDWNDGRLLLSLVEAMQPGSCRNVPDDPLERCRYAIEMAEANFHVPKLLQAEDLCNPAVDELSVMTYLSYFVSLGDVEDTGDVDQLLDWVHDMLPACNLTNFDSDWHSGIALVGLVDAISPGAYPDWMDLNPDAGEDNFQLGIDLARQHLNVDLEMAAEELVASGVGNDLGFMPLIAEVQTAGREVTSAANCFAFGDGLIEATVGAKAVFNVQHQSRASHIAVEIVTADGKPVADQMTGAGGELVVGFTPLAAGECRVRVTCCGRDIPSSPFTVDVRPEPDASSCRVHGSGIGGAVLVNQCQEFTVDAHTAGPGDLKVLLQDVRSTLACIEEVKTGVYNVSYTPLEVGRLEVLILLGGKLIDDSPGPVLVLDPSKVLLGGEGLTTACVGQRTVFTADTRLAGPGELQVSFAPGQARGQARLEASREDGRIYVVEYEPLRLGRLALEVRWSGMAVLGGSAAVSVVKPGYTGAVSLDADKITLGDVVDLTARLQGGGKRTSDGQLTAKARGLKTGPTPVQVKVGADDVFHIEMTPKLADEYFIDIFFDRVPIAGSPLRAVFANPCHPELVVAEGPASGSVGRRIEYVVDTSQAGGGDLEVYVTGPAHGDLFVAVEQGQSPTEHRLLYTPDAEGKHSLEIRWSGTPIPGSPFALDIVGDAADAAKVRVHYEAELLKRILLGEPFVMAFDTSDTGHDEFSAMAVAEASSQSTGIGVMEQDEDVFTLTFEPTAPGDYALYVFYGEGQVTGSPFALRVVTGRGEVEVESVRFGDVGDPVLISLRLADVARRDQLGITANSPEDLEPEDVVDVTLQDDDTLLAQYMPTVSGQHHFEVLWRRGQIVDGSFDVDITPARHSAAPGAVARARAAGGPSGSPQRASRRRSGVASLVRSTFAEATVGERVSATVQAAGMAIADIGGQLTDPGGKTSAVEVLTNGMGAFTVVALLEQSGRHELAITISGRAIAGSPFLFEAAAAEPAASAGSGGGSLRASSKRSSTSAATAAALASANLCTVSKVPSTVMVGVACRFIVDARIAGAGDLSVAVASGPLRQTDISISRLRDKVYAVQLAPWVPGNVQLSVLFGGKPVPASPVAITFLDCTPDATKCHANTESPLQVATNSWQRVLVNTEGAGRGTLTAVLKSKTFEAPLLIERQARFLYRCAFLTQTPGDYDLIIKWAGEHIPGSPFTVNSVHKCYPEKISVIYLKTAKIEQPCILAVDTSEAGIGVLAVKATDPSGKDVDVNLKKAKDAKRKVMAEFVPKSAGKHQINIKWSRIQVPGSPFLVTVL